MDIVEPIPPSSESHAPEQTILPRFETEQWVPFPLERVFAFFSDPRNLVRILPPPQRARVRSMKLVPHSDTPSAAGSEAGAGSEITLSLRAAPPLPFRAIWTARITAFERNRYFEDEQVRGPFRRWLHRHEFRAEERGGQQGTLVRDRIDYDPGWGALGRLANRFFIEKQLRSTFAHRQGALEALLREF